MCLRFADKWGLSVLRWTLAGIDEVADGSFSPDNPRSQFFKRKDPVHGPKEVSCRMNAPEDCASVKSSLAEPSVLSELHDFQGEEVPGHADAMLQPLARGPEPSRDDALDGKQVLGNSDDSDSSTDSHPWQV